MEDNEDRGITGVINYRLVFNVGLGVWLHWRDSHGAVSLGELPCQHCSLEHVFAAVIIGYGIRVIHRIRRTGREVDTLTIGSG